MEWNFDDSQPIYQQIVDTVQQAVASGQFAPGEKLPPVRDMAAEAGVNPNTMQRALAEMETRGLLNAQRTSGRFVTEDNARITALRKTLAESAARRYVAGMRALGCAAEEMENYVREAAQNGGEGNG